MAIAPESDHGWLEISITIDPAAREAMCAYLFELGCTGVVTDDFGDGIVRAYFSLEDDLDEIRNRIGSRLRELIDFFPEISPPEIRFIQRDGEDWSTGWRRFFHTERVTESLTVVPAWESAPRAGQGAVIRIDPGPAFGTGKHPTTRMCLRAMEMIPRPESWAMLDVGTGSGILAIYGARLGAERVVATDIDPDAVRWAERNIRMNGLEGTIELTSRFLEDEDRTFFMVTANLILETILDLMPHFYSLLDSGGWLVLSGLLREQVGSVKFPLEKEGFSVHQILLQEEWASVLARKHS